MRQARNKRYADKKAALAFDGALLRKVPRVKDAYAQGFVILKKLIAWSGKWPAYYIRTCDSLEILSDEDASDLRAYCSRPKRTFIFNDDQYGRAQYSLSVPDLTFGVQQQIGHLKSFLQAAFLHGELSSWTCLESMPNSQRQALHSDYPKSVVAEACRDGNLLNIPFACEFLCCAMYLCRDL